MKRPSLSRSEKRLLIGSSLAVLLLSGSGLLWNAERGGDIPPHAPLPTPNGFDLYLAAASLMTRPNPPVDAVNDTKIRSPQQAAQLYTPARRAAFVAANAKVWSLMRQARAAQTQHPDTRANFGGTFFPYGSLRELARVKTIEAKHFKDLKRFDLALQSGLDSMEMGRDIEHGAPLIGSLVGIAVEAIGGASLEDVPPHLSAQDARSGARRLEEIIRNGASAAEVLCEEKWTVLSMVKSNFGSKPSFSGSLMFRFTGSSIGPMMDDYIAQSAKPFPSQTVPPLPKGIFSIYAQILHDGPKGYGFSVARRQTKENELLLRLALRAYRLEHGAYPETLAGLAPKYLAQIPRDPFGRGEAMRYQKSGDSYLAWSIGPDGKDDGGTPIAIKTGKKRVVIAKDSRGDAVVKP